MKGYLYKELKQYRNIIYLFFLVVLYVVFGAIVMTMATAGTITREAILLYATEGMEYRLLILFFGFIFAMSLEEYTFQGDDTKIWGFFVASNPKGIRGYIYTKYGLTFAMSVIYFLLTAGLDFCLTRMVSVIAGGELPVMGEVMAVLLCIQLLYHSITIPFAVRFGNKRGNMIKMIFAILVTIGVVGIALEHPVETSEFIDGIIHSESITEYWNWWLPVVSVLAYILSCLLSVKLYRKGVMQYYR